uniref:Small ribosomal subunit protein uS3c n=1 Tax=Lobochlamys segnis TaxID=52035 RepID=A0A0S2IBM5_9CHLO|nr:ribosomal protein S3 [Lobochlamys segnis]
MTSFIFKHFMGQKVHPLGFRVGITKKHQSQWFAKFTKYNYAQSVLEDRLLRTTLLKLFPELLNPVLKKVQKREEDITILPKITQIKIERGLIPYEIGIQIHAENCELIKAAIDKLKIDRDLACHLQKARQYLVNLGNNLATSNKVNGMADNLELANSSSENINSSEISKRLKSTKKRVKRGLGVLRSEGKQSFQKNKKRFFRQPKLTKQEYKKKKLVQKRLRNRQIIRRWYRQFIAKGLFIKKVGKKIQRKVITKRGKNRFNRFKRSATLRTTGQSFLRQKSEQGKKVASPSPAKAGAASLASQREAALSTNKSIMGSAFLNSKSSISESLRPKTATYFRIKRKFLTMYLNKINQKFFKNLRGLMKYWFEHSAARENTQVLGNSSVRNALNFNFKKSTNFSSISFNFAPVGYSPDWDISETSKKFKSLKNQSLTKLKKLFEILEKKSFLKLQSLKQSSLAFGNISHTQAYSFFQMIIFLKNLKKLIKKRYSIILQKYQRNQKNYGMRNGSHTENIEFSSTTNGVSLKPWEKTLAYYNQSQSQKALKRIGTNVDDECRKIKFIEYLKQLVKKHRTENLFYYLSTLSEARKDLKKLKKFTQNHAEFLFGVNLTKSSTEQENLHSNQSQEYKDQITKVLQQSNSKIIMESLIPSFRDSAYEIERTLQNSFIEQIEKQKIISKENLKLTPKICIKFYSVKQQNLESKASFVADSIIDALEKRKAFRKVIKDAKEKLMSNSRLKEVKVVKGVKIQVSGRLNGAEIARTEWVRAGRVPLQTLRANIDYSYKTANTIYGIIGVKVWLFKGYSKTL